MPRTGFDAVLLDLDGVVTETAHLHARAWKQMFDSYLAHRRQWLGETHAPFDRDQDYRRYVDGKPRDAGVRSFLASRGIDLPEGTPQDTPDQGTIRGLGNRKNQIVRDLFAQEGTQVYEDAREQIQHWREQGLKLAIVSSSKNCQAILESTGLMQLFAARVDGRDIEARGMPGKPAPDMMLYAAQKLGVNPARTVVIEDAVAGVQAAVAGGFGLVVGVSRNGAAEGLHQAGAHRVVRSLQELGDFACVPASLRQSPACLPSTLLGQDALLTELASRDLALFLDYDGTLTPIVDQPDQAWLRPEIRSLLGQLSQHCILAIISGRDLQDVKHRIQLPQLVYAGSHGFDIEGPNGLRNQLAMAQRAIPAIDRAERSLRQLCSGIPGVLLERKQFGLAVHYRQVAASDIPRLEHFVRTITGNEPQLRMRSNKCVFEVQPEVNWDKGRAVDWLIDALHLNRSTTTVIYVGDDRTDEDAFRTIQALPQGIGIRVGDGDEPSRADYCLGDPDEVCCFLHRLGQTLAEKEEPGE